MLLTRDPLTMFEQMRRELNNLMDHYDHGLFRRPRAFPPVNVWEDASALYAEVETPGFDMNDVELFVQANELTIKGRRESQDKKDWTYHRRERSTGEFVRTIVLPMHVNSEAVEATLKDGVLTIAMPKAEEAKARKVKVRAE